MGRWCSVLLIAAIGGARPRPPRPGRGSPPGPCSSSSGAPHLHFEGHDADGNLVDPYQGPCSQWSSDSWWLEQRPYHDSAINHLRVGSSPVVLGTCPQEDQPNEKDSVVRGETLYLTSYYRDRLSTQTSEHTLYESGAVAAM
jgi:hypothetical protein